MIAVFLFVFLWWLSYFIWQLNLASLSGICILVIIFQVSNCVEWLTENTRVWTPFPMIHRMSSLKLKNTLGREMAKVVIQKKGTDHFVKLQSQFVVTFGCPMRFSQFPFDEHTCTFNVEMTDVKINLEKTILRNKRPSEQDYEFTVRCSCKYLMSDQLLFRSRKERWWK